MYIKHRSGHSVSQFQMISTKETLRSSSPGVSGVIFSQLDRRFPQKSELWQVSKRQKPSKCLVILFWIVLHANKNKKFKKGWGSAMRLGSTGKVRTLLLVFCWKSLDQIKNWSFLTSSKEMFWSFGFPNVVRSGFNVGLYPSKSENEKT